MTTPTKQHRWRCRPFSSLLILLIIISSRDLYVTTTSYAFLSLTTAKRTQRQRSQQLPSFREWPSSGWRHSRATSLHVHSSSSPVKIVKGPFSSGLLQSLWQTGPVLIRNAFPDFDKLQCDEWPTETQLVDLVTNTEEDVLTRLIQHEPDIGASSYTLKVGPFDKRRLHQLLWNDDNRTSTSSVWSVVVNDVEQFHPPLADWMDREVWSFLPRWRRDDAQISFACRQGGIGPHVDHYDVVLIQMQGVREWQVGRIPLTVAQENDMLTDGLDVRILRDIEGHTSLSSYTIQPGDALYLPPRYVHCGTALSDHCMTLSVGCRAPSAADVTSRVAQALLGSTDGTAVRRYRDSEMMTRLGLDGNNHNSHSGEITSSVKQQLKGMVLDAVQHIVNDEEMFDQLVGELVTEPNRPRDNYPVPLEDIDDDDGVCWNDAERAVEQVLEHGNGALFRAEGISFAYSVLPNNGNGTRRLRLFANGETFELQQSSEEGLSWSSSVLESIVNAPVLTRESLEPNCVSNNGDRKTIRKLLEQLVERGLLYGTDEL